MSENNSDLEKARKKLEMLDGGNQFGSGGFYDSENRLGGEQGGGLREGFKKRKLSFETDKDAESQTGSKISKNVDISQDEAKSFMEGYEQSNAYNVKTLKNKLRRNKVLITVLLILLIASLVTILIAYIFLNLDKTCKINIQGDSSAVCVVDGYEMKSFRVPSSIRGNRILKLDIDLKLKGNAKYNIKYKAICFQDEDVLANTQIYKPNEVVFEAGVNGYYQSIEPIVGGKTIDLCGGIIIDYHYEDSLNVKNFSMEFVIIVEKV